MEPGTDAVENRQGADQTPAVSSVPQSGGRQFDRVCLVSVLSLLAAVATACSWIMVCSEWGAASGGIRALNAEIRVVDGRPQAFLFEDTLVVMEGGRVRAVSFAALYAQTAITVAATLVLCAYAWDRLPHGRSAVVLVLATLLLMVLPFL